MAVPASFNDLAADAAVRDYFGDVWYQTTVRVPARLGRRSASCCTSSRPRTAPRSGSATHEVVSPRGRLHPVRGRRHRARRPPAQQARITVVVNNTLSFQTHPARASSRTPRRASGSATGTTSSTTPACTARSGCTARRRPHLDDVTVVTGLDGATGTVDYQVEAADADGAARSRVVLRDADGREVATRRGRARHPDRAGRAPLGPGRRLPLRPRGPAGRRRGRRRRQLPPERRRPHGRGATASGSSSTANPSTSRVSASTRTCR